jgi:hypothetical protein
VVGGVRKEEQQQSTGRAHIKRITTVDLDIELSNDTAPMKPI